MIDFLAILIMVLLLVFVICIMSHEPSRCVDTKPGGSQSEKKEIDDKFKLEKEDFDKIMSLSHEVSYREVNMYGGSRLFNADFFMDGCDYMIGGYRDSSGLGFFSIYKVHGKSDLSDAGSILNYKEVFEWIDDAGIHKEIYGDSQKNDKFMETLRNQ